MPGNTDFTAVITRTLQAHGDEIVDIRLERFFYTQSTILSMSPIRPILSTSLENRDCSELPIQA